MLRWRLGGNQGSREDALTRCLLAGACDVWLGRCVTYEIFACGIVKRKLLETRPVSLGRQRGRPGQASPPLL